MCPKVSKVYIDANLKLLELMINFLLIISHQGPICHYDKLCYCTSDYIRDIRSIAIEIFLFGGLLFFTLLSKWIQSDPKNGILHVNFFILPNLQIDLWSFTLLVTFILYNMFGNKSQTNSNTKFDRSNSSLVVFSRGFCRQKML